MTLLRAGLGSSATAMFLLFALVETIGGVVGGILEAQRGTRFVFSESLEDACFAFSALGLVAVVLRCACRFVSFVACASGTA